MDNLQLGEEQDLILDTVRKLVAEEAAPHALEHDERREFVAAGYRQLAESGLLGLPVAEANGGAGMQWLSFVVALEEIARGCGSTARVLLVQAGLCGKALDGLADVGNAAVTSLLGGIVAGEQRAAWIGPEAGLLAAGNGASLALTGTARLVTSGAVADVLVVAARTEGGEPLLLHVDAAAAGVQRAPAPALGFRAAAPAMLTFAGAPLAAEAVLARGDAASAAWRRAATAANVGGAAIAVGLAQAAFDAARRHAQERVAFGKPLIALEAVANKLVECRRRVQASRHTVYHAARLLDDGQEAGDAAILARLAAQDAAVFAGDEAIQIHGGYGYTVEYHVERHYRDACTLAVLDGGRAALVEAVVAGIRSA